MFAGSPKPEIRPDLPPMKRASELPAPTKPASSETPAPSFDKRAYQREYMRKRREARAK